MRRALSGVAVLLIGAAPAAGLAPVLQLTPKSRAPASLLSHQLEPGSENLEHIRLLQWNMHGECFLRCDPSNPQHCDPAYPACQGNATARLREMLEDSNGSPTSLDFAGVEQLNDREFLMSGLSSTTAWSRISQRCGGEEGFGVRPYDNAQLYYNTRRWDVLDMQGSPIQHGGCMEAVDGSVERNYRAFTVRAFQRKGGDGVKLVVAVAHFPHPDYAKDFRAAIAFLREAISDVQQRAGVQRLILVADTNHDKPGGRHGMDSRGVIEQVYPDAVSVAGGVASTELLRLCCHPLYLYAFDRVIAAGFSAASDPMETVQPFGGTAPPWTALNMHSPVIGDLAYSRSGVARGAPLARVACLAAALAAAFASIAIPM